MRVKESMIRRIIKEEAKRVLREGSFPEEIEAVYGEEPPSEMRDESSSKMDPTGLVEMYMTHIEDLFAEGDDPHEAMSEAEGMIDDLCEELKDSMHMWLRSYLREEQGTRGEYERDMAEDR
jgi:hypothetical protein